MQALIELAIITAAASVINLVDAEGFTSMLVLKLSVANILHAPESIDPTSAETWIQAVQSSIFRLSSFHSRKLKLELQNCISAPKQVRDRFSISANLFSLSKLFASCSFEHAHHMLWLGA